MARYQLNYDLIGENPDRYEELENGLRELFGEVSRGRLDSTFEFDHYAQDPKTIRDMIGAFFEMRLAMKFEVINIEEGGNAYGETMLGFMRRVGGF